MEKVGWLQEFPQKKRRNTPRHAGVEREAKGVEGKKQDSRRRENQYSVRPATPESPKRHASLSILHCARGWIPRKVALKSSTRCASRSWRADECRYLRQAIPGGQLTQNKTPA